MKVIYVITGLDVAGAETQVRDVALALKSRGHDVSLVSLTKPLAYLEQLRAAGIPVMSLGVERQRQNWFAAGHAIYQLRNRLRQERPDIVHSHMVHANILSRLATIGSGGAPLICTVHNIHEGGWVRDFAYMLTNSMSALNTTISLAATERFVTGRVLPKNKTITVYNGIDTARFKPKLVSRADGKTFRWVAVGRLQQQKDYPTLLRSIAELSDHSLDIFGKGELQSELENLTSELGVADRVRFLGVTNELSRSLLRYDGFVLSSAWEGFGLVVAEAMAAGLPVVATLSGGPQEIVGLDGAAGVLVPIGSPEALSGAMSRVAALSPEQRRRMGQAGRQRIMKKFGMQAIVERWEGIYRALVCGRPVS